MYTNENILVYVVQYDVILPDESYFRIKRKYILSNNIQYVKDTFTTPQQVTNPPFLMVILMIPD
jgi:hypothetical protein